MATTSAMVQAVASAIVASGNQTPRQVRNDIRSTPARARLIRTGNLTVSRSNTRAVASAMWGPPVTQTSSPPRSSSAIAVICASRPRSRNSRFGMSTKLTTTAAARPSRETRLPP